MKPPMRARQNVLVPFDNAEKPWSRKEKESLLKALETVPFDDYKSLQRQVPSRSTAEICEYFASCQRKRKRELIQQDIEEPDVKISKKWRDCATLLLHGDADYSTAVATCMKVASTSSKPVTIGGHHKLDLSQIYSFLAHILEGERPFDYMKLDAFEAVALLTVMEDLKKEAEKSGKMDALTMLQKMYKDTMKATPEELAILSEPIVSNLPTTVYESRYLNPFNMSEEMTQDVNDSA